MSRIKSLITGKDPRQRATIKGQQIAIVVHAGVFKRTGLQIDVHRITAIDGGVEVLASAREGKKKVGFGHDGTIETERFRIFNPPILVDDSMGDIELPETNPRTGEVTMRKLREDPKQALVESLTHIIKNVKKDGSNVVSGKVGNTTSTFYPSMDGGVATLDSASGWAAVRGDTTGSYPNYTATTLQDGGHGSTCGVHTYAAADFNITRSFTLFDTSAIADTDIITSATLSLYVTSVEFALENNSYAYAVPVSGSPASDTEVVAGDIDNIGSTAFATGIRMEDITTGAYVDWALNASGLAAVSKTDKSRFAWRVGHDLENVQPTSGLSNKVNGIYSRASEFTGTSSDPTLIVVHAAAATGHINLPLLGVG